LGYRNGKVEKTGAGYVIYTTDGAGYVLTNASVIRTADNVEVLPNLTNLKAALDSPAGSNRSINRLPAEVLEIEPPFDYALLEVPGLNRPVLKFASRFSAAGDTVWSVANSTEIDAMMTVEKGKVRSAYNLQSNDIGLLSHNAVVGLPGEGSLLVNECSEIVGLNMTFDRPDLMVRAIDGASLVRIIQKQNLDVLLSAEPCMVEVATAKIEAEQAAAVARQDQAAIQDAQAEKLAQRDEQSKSLVLETRKLGQAAEQALLKAEVAGLESKKALQEFEKQADYLREYTKELVVQMERGRIVSEAEFERAPIKQQDDAYRRELLLILILGVSVLAILVALFVARKRKPTNNVRDAARVKEGDSSGETVFNKPQLAKYVLDGCDESGIRYLLRISGDQLGAEDGIVIGRNPVGSPYTINHADVSRKHVRMKVMKNKVFIEDLGSTNGTSLNGQSIGDQGPISVDNGDRIIFGSVVMKLKILGA
jgi:hypothetical protein